MKLGLCLGAWALAMALGFHLLLGHGSRPGERGTTPAIWPADGRVTRDTRRPTLVMAVHPRCPCTRASLAELAKVVARCEGRLSVILLVYHPVNASDDWSNVAWRRGLRDAGYAIVDDLEGVEAARLGALTSGHVTLYDREGRLRFSGGITADRGHEGDSAGHDAVVRIVRHASAECVDADVFGCPIRATPPPTRITTDEVLDGRPRAGGT